ncbi:MAG: hypothetical protein ABI140_11605 [Jatrophihabitantaceae bacterium]
MIELILGKFPALRSTRYVQLLGKYLSGCLLFAIGAYLFIYSKLGTDPLDTFALGVLRHLPLTIGLVQLSVAIACVTAVSLWLRQRPRLAPLFTFFFCGSIIDLERKLDPMTTVHIPAVVILTLGTLCCAYGSALIIMSGFGIRAIDLLAIAAVRQWRWPFWTGKAIIELSLLATGYLLGGPAGWGTVFFLVGVDLLIQPMVWSNVRVLGLVNHGLPHPRRLAQPQPEVT